MIGRLSGVLLEKRPPSVLLDVHGVGYEVAVPMSTFYLLPDLGQRCSLHAHLLVRDDAHLLFGFSSEVERGLFRALIKVNGVGAKVALAILSGISSEDFTLGIDSGDIAMLTRLPGIGKKTAERLVVELRGKLDDPPLSGVPGDGLRGAADGAARATAAQAIKALAALGYKSADAAKMVKSVATDSATIEQIIRLALQSKSIQR